MNTNVVPIDDQEQKRAIGAAVRRAREQRGLSGSEVANRAGKRPGTISDIENGKSLPDLATLLAIAEALDASLDELLGRSPRAVPPTAIRLGALEGDVALIVERGESQEEAILEILAALVESNLLTQPFAVRLSRLLDALRRRREGTE